MSGCRHRPTTAFLPLIWENVSISVLFRLKNVVNVDILCTGKCKTKLSMCYSLQTSADGSRLPRPGRAYGPAASWLTVTVEVGRDMRVGPTYLIQKISWNRIFSVWWKYYGSVISDRLCFICLIWHTRGDKPVLPWLSRKNSDLLVRKTTLDTVERWLALGPGRHVTVRRTRRCIYNCDPKEPRSAIL